MAAAEDGLRAAMPSASRADARMAAPLRCSRADWDSTTTHARHGRRWQETLGF